jgi:hypothetical protein
MTDVSSEENGEWEVGIFYLNMQKQKQIVTFSK